MKQLSAPASLGLLLFTILFCSSLIGFFSGRKRRECVSEQASEDAEDGRFTGGDRLIPAEKAEPKIALPDQRTHPLQDKLPPGVRISPKKIIFDPLNGSELTEPVILTLNHPRLGIVKFIVNQINVRFYVKYGPEFFSLSLLSMNTRVWCFNQSCLVASEGEDFAEINFFEFYNDFLSDYRFEDLGFKEGVETKEGVCYWNGEIQIP